MSKDKKIMEEKSKGHLERILAIDEDLLRPNMREVDEDTLITTGRDLIKDAKEIYFITHIPFIPLHGNVSATQYGLLAIRGEGRTTEDYTLLTMRESSRTPYIHEKEICRQIGIIDISEPEVHGGEISGLGKMPEKRIYKLK